MSRARTPHPTATHYSPASSTPSEKSRRGQTMPSAGVPESIHQSISDRLKIPMNENARSLNIASSVAIVLAESLRQTKLL